MSSCVSRYCDSHLALCRNAIHTVLGFAFLFHCVLTEIATMHGGLARLGRACDDNHALLHAFSRSTWSDFNAPTRLDQSAAMAVQAAERECSNLVSVGFPAS